MRSLIGPGLTSVSLSALANWTRRQHHSYAQLIFSLRLSIPSETYNDHATDLQFSKKLSSAVFQSVTVDGGACMTEVGVKYPERLRAPRHCNGAEQTGPHHCNDASLFLHARPPKQLVKLGAMKP